MYLILYYVSLIDMVYNYQIFQHVKHKTVMQKIPHVSSATFP